MENAAEALKLAFYVIVFVLALSLSISTLTKAKQTSDMVLTIADETRYYEYEQINVDDIGNSVDADGSRIVGLETVIPTLYKYDKERYKVVFKQGNYDLATGEVTNVTPLEIYKTQTTRANWNKDYINDYDGRTTRDSAYNEMRICSFDIVEETQRNEPWVGDSNQIKLHLDAILNGREYILPQFAGSKILDYSGNKLSKAGNRNDKFKEEIGRVSTVTTDAIKGNKTTTKIIITYTLLQ